MTKNGTNLTDKFIVGLTGGIGSGKTAVSDWFADKGIAVVDADVIAHAVVAAGSPTLDELVRAFGDWVVDADGNMDRAAMRQHVFGDAVALRQLEAITHPAVRHQMHQQLQRAASAYVILSVPLLLDNPKSGLKSLCDRVLVVDVTEATQVTRASLRDGQTEAGIRAIMAKQLPRQDRIAQADDVVDNNGSFTELYAQLAPLHKRYLQLAKA